MAELTMRATRPGQRSRRPKSVERHQVCATEDCSTIVSRYNLSDHCFRHRPVKYPRLRGVFSDEYTQQNAE